MRGVPLARWGIGLTVLLEKVSSETLVTKLRVIYLFEANFSYWTTLIFTCRIMKKARDEDDIPDEVYAKNGSHYSDVTMTKVFFYGLSKIMRHPSAITEADLGKCNDRMAHTPTSKAMESCGVLNCAVKLVLTALLRLI